MARIFYKTDLVIEDLCCNDAVSLCAKYSPKNIKKDGLTLPEVMEVGNKVRRNAAIRIKELSVNERLDRIEAKLNNLPQEPVILGDYDEREYGWSDADELGIKDHWDDVFFAEMEKVGNISFIIMRMIEVMNDFGGDEEDVTIKFGSDD